MNLPLQVSQKELLEILLNIAPGTPCIYLGRTGNRKVFLSGRICI